MEDVAIVSDDEAFDAFDVRRFWSLHVAGTKACLNVSSQFIPGWRRFQLAPFWSTSPSFPASSVRRAGKRAAEQM
jgi:hypothetical protein